MDAQLPGGGQAAPAVALQGLGAGFVPSILNTKIYDEVIRVKETDSGPVSKQVNQLDGIPIGISSGAAVWAAIQLSKRPENKGKQIVVIGDTPEQFAAYIRAESEKWARVVKQANIKLD